MLSRLKVRTKLLAVLLPLLLGVGALAGLGVMDRLDAERQAARDLVQFRVARAASDVVHALEVEQLMAAAAQAGAPVSDPTLEEQAALTDQKVRALGPLLAEFATDDELIGTQTRAQIASDALRQLRNIDQARANVTPLGSQLAVINNYSAIFDHTVTMSSRLLNAADSGGTGSALHWLSEAKATDARAAADVIAIIEATNAGELADGAWAVEEVAELTSQSSHFTEVFTTDTDDYGRQTYNQVLQSNEYAASQAAFSSLDEISPETGLTTPVGEWVAESAARLHVLHGAEVKLLDRQIAVAAAAKADLEREVRLFLAGSATALLMALLFALWVTRSITTNLRALTDAATTISTQQLPKLVDSLHSPDPDVGIRPTEIDVRSQDEFADLANAFVAVEQAAIDVANEQAKTLRKGISDIFVNLARRNQSLLDRQIEFIDRLEANEEDPDQLENLFRLDHLATRMRRNAESLLVLAGAEGPRRRAKEVSVSDIVRVAVGEVEDFARITLLAVDEAMATGSAAVDVAHLLAELMENGTQYSPPDRRVEVVGMRSAEGSYIITLSDHGVGMTAEAMAAANRQLATPPIVGLSLSRSLGFIVVSTLAARHGIGVRLTDSPSGGVTAVVTLPAALMVDEAPPSLLDMPAAGFEPEPTPAPEPADSWSFESFGGWADSASDAEPSHVTAEPAPELSAFTAAPATDLSNENPWGDLPDWSSPLTEATATATEDQLPDAVEDWTASAGYVEPEVTPLPAAPEVNTSETPMWSAEVNTIGEPEPVPSNDHPMGAAFEQGVYSLLHGDSNGTTEPDVADPEVAAQDVAAPEVAGHDLAEAPSFDEGMRRTSMWQARVDSVATPEHSVATPEPAAHPAPPVPVPAPAPAPAPAPTPAPMASDEVDGSLAAPLAPIFNAPSPTAPIAHPVPPVAHPPAPTAPIVHPPASLAPISHPVAPTPSPDDLGLPRRVPGEAAGAPSFAEVTPPIGAPAPAASDGALPRRTPARRGPFEPKGAGGLIGTSRRPAEEIRNILSSYRSGLSSGRADAPSADQAESTPAPSGAPETPEQ